MHPSLQEEQKLLQLKAEALRLKLLSNQMRRQQEASEHDIWGIVSSLPKAGLLWRLANMPHKVRNKFILGAGLLALLYLRF
ncbi:hypothetical protein CBP31_02545 [Oceanisphaera profunda]|uniref:Uncharacterized protein n=1 Tax=Oceanisphaera profunda TaxID=1416627 RepID=A0A1Y0D355_9GAMM|nr:hypothetical protein [Oceanisphaera profunda]ART81647.1 hypothetical protein CBP31_02545 [Oceanisphaera profunda]